MKIVLFAAALTAAASSGVRAADMSAFVKAPIAPRATYDWTGLYFGGHIGGGWSDLTFNDPSTSQTFNGLAAGPVFLGGPGDLTASSSSFLGGVQAGFNYQIGRFVLGSEFDYSWTTLKTTAAGSFPVNPAVAGIASGSETLNSSTTGIGTATTRLGVARDNWLFYGKAGLAWARTHDSLSASDTVVGVLSPAAGSLSRTHVGWTIGTGLEWAFAPNWTTKIEYDYIDLGTWAESIPIGGVDNLTTGLPFAANSTVNVRAAVSELKFGLNYKMPAGFLFW